MADPTLHTVLDAIVTALGTPQSGVMYEPGASNVHAVLFWPDETLLVQQGVDTAYFIRPGRETRGLPDSGTVTCRLEVFVLAAHRVPTIAGQLQEDPARWQIDAELCSDVMTKLIAAENTKTSPIVSYLFGESGTVEIDHERYLDQWVCPEMRITVLYRHERNER